MHRAQVRICHEKIADDPKVLHRLGEQGLDNVPTKWCSVKSPLLWCYDCDRYVCSWHATSRHETHRTEPE